jgi:hypothetical protein
MKKYILRREKKGKTKTKAPPKNFCRLGVLFSSRALA